MGERLNPLSVLPRVATDVLLTRAELARVLTVPVRQVPALVRKPFAADPDAVPARVALGLSVLGWLARQNLPAELAVHVAVNAQDADPTQHRFLVAGHVGGEPASAWVTSEVVNSDAVDLALRRKGFAIFDKSFVPADLLFFDLLGQVSRMRAEAAA